jgi:hypothetical protein
VVIQDFYLIVWWRLKRNTNKKYVIIFKEDLLGGSWSISEESQL